MSRNFILQENGGEVSVEWRIKHFLSLPEKPNYRLHSPAFSFSDGQWFLMIWPNGQTRNDSVGWMSLHLGKRFTTSKLHRVKFSMGLKKSDGSLYKSLDFEHEFENHYGYGTIRFVQASEFRKSEGILTYEGTLIVFATVRLAEPLILDEDIVDIFQKATFRATQTEETFSEWEIEGFSPLPKRMGFSVKSPFFSFAGALWCMVVYFNGNNTENLGWVSLFLRRERSSFKNHTVAFTLGIRKPDTTVYRLVHHEEEFTTNMECGGKKFLELSELLDAKKGLISGGSFRVFCIARVNSTLLPTAAPLERGTQTFPTTRHEEKTSQTTQSERERVSRSSVKTLIQQLKHLVVSGYHADVTFKVREQAFPANRLILTTRSPVFSAMFENDTEEKKTGIVTITDFQPDTIKHLLFFIYTGDVDLVSSGNAVDLYKAAHKYDIQDLKDAAVLCMTQELSSEVFFDVVVLALVYDESKLLETASNFFVENMNLILSKSEWLPFMQEHSVLANELLLLGMKIKM